jgi:hypothetical protein
MTTAADGVAPNESTQASRRYSPAQPWSRAPHAPGDPHPGPPARAQADAAPSASVGNPVTLTRGSGARPVACS